MCRCSDLSNEKISKGNLRALLVLSQIKKNNSKTISHKIYKQKNKINLTSKISNGEFLKNKIARDETGVLLEALENDIGEEIEEEEVDAIWHALKVKANKED